MTPYFVDDFGYIWRVVTPGFQRFGGYDWALYILTREEAMNLSPITEEQAWKAIARFPDRRRRKLSKGGNP